MSQKVTTQINSEKDPNFKVLYADGIIGKVDQMGGQLTFYVDIPEIETTFVEGQGAVVSVHAIKRVYLVDIRMSTENIKIHAEWMKNNFESYEKAVKSGVGQSKPSDTLQIQYQ